MPFLNKYLQVLVGFMILSLGLWVVTSFVERCDPSMLLRAGLVLLGIGAIAWGLHRDEGRLVAIGLLLLTVGVFCFQLEGRGGYPGFVSRLGYPSDVGYRLWRFVSLPLQGRLQVPVGYLLLGIWVVVNAMMFAQRVPPRTIVGANLIFLVGLALMHLLWPR
jgi:hypothetical protein